MTTYDDGNTYGKKSDQVKEDQKGKNDRKDDKGNRK